MVYNSEMSVSKKIVFFFLLILYIEIIIYYEKLFYIGICECRVC